MRRFVMLIAVPWVRYPMARKCETGTPDSQHAMTDIDNP
jgi:hypothetical protein